MISMTIEALTRPTRPLAGVSEEARYALAKESLEVCYQMEQQLTAEVNATAEKVNDVLSAVTELETEILRLRDEIRQLKALVTVAVPV
jgi:uncharacterized protein YoxC